VNIKIRPLTLRDEHKSWYRARINSSTEPPQSTGGDTCINQEIFLFVAELTKHRGRVVTPPASGGTGFKSRPRDQLPSLRFFAAFLSSSRQMPGSTLNQAMAASFHILSSSLSINHPIRTVYRPSPSYSHAFLFRDMASLDDNYPLFCILFNSLPCCKLLMHCPTALKSMQSLSGAANVISQSHTRILCYKNIIVIK
jgi:hypothetical protein